MTKTKEPLKARDATESLSEENAGLEQVFDSPASEPDDLLWLEQGKKMLADSVALTTVRDAAKSLMTGLGALQGIYLGILGFAKFIPEGIHPILKLLFVTPLLPWGWALYCCITVLRTEEMEINLHSPAEIKAKAQATVKAKQASVDRAFQLLEAGISIAIVLVLLRFWLV